MIDQLDIAHADLRLRQFADMRHRDRLWSAWPKHAECAAKFVAAHLAMHGYRTPPTDSIDWPGGWFVRFADGGVVFVPVTFRGHGHVALFPRHLSIVEVS